MTNCFFSPNSARVRRGVLLVHFGTPAAPSLAAVRTFLSHVFDKNLVAVPRIIREGWIIPKRLFSVTKKYRAIWTPQGSPLLVQSRLFARDLAATLPPGTAVTLGMQFGSPSIEEGIDYLKSLGVEDLSIVLHTIPKQVVDGAAWVQQSHIHEFVAQPWYEQALASRLVDSHPEAYEKVLFSFHGLPVQTAPSYRSECLQTAANVAAAACLPKGKALVAFQSKVGRGEWTEPSTRSVLTKLRTEGVRRVLVICPSFVVDCLENMYEVGVEYRSEFLRLGGTELSLVPSLNQYRPWVNAVSAYLKGQWP